MVSLCHYSVRVANVAPFNILLNMKDLRVSAKHYYYYWYKPVDFSSFLPRYSSHNDHVKFDSL